MKPNRTALFMAVLSVFFVGTAMTQPARAYVLEGPHILALAADAMGPIAALRVAQKVLIFPQTPDQPSAVFDQSAVFVMPERFRSDIVSDPVRRTHLVFADSSMTVIDGRLTTGDDPFDSYQTILRSRTRRLLMRNLNGLGVETAITSLGRFEDQVMFVIGARYPNESVNQLAIDHVTFLPVRLLQVAGDQRMAIVYRNWQKLQSGWFPFQVDFLTGDRLIRQIRVVDVEINPSIPASLMDFEALKATLASGGDTPREDAQQAVDAVQQAVQDFQKKFE